nr:hypothetical protein [Tanacetum cinerariifolium]
MTDNRTMAEMLRAPTEGCAEAIVVPPILAEQFVLKHSLINMMTSEQFFWTRKGQSVRSRSMCMRTRSSSNLPVESPHNPSTSNPKRRNRRRSKKPFILKESLVDTMADQHTMVELMRAPTEGYAEEIVVPLILAEQFELKHSLINMMTSDQFFELEKDNPHDHIRAARRWLEKEPPCSILTWENLVSKFINEFFPPSRTTNLVNQQTSAVTTAMTAILKQFQATPPPASVKVVEEICVTCGGAHPYYQCLAVSGNTFPELRDNIQGYIAVAAINYNQGNFGYRPPEEDERVEETLTNQDLAEYTIKVPPPLKMLDALLSNKEKLLELANTPLNKNCLVVILKKLLEKLGDPGKFLILCSFSLPELISTGMTLKLANRAICTSAGIARDVFVSVGKFTFPADFVIDDYESNPRVLLILGRPFLRTTRALIDVNGEDMILRDGDERLTLNMRHDTSSYSNQPQKESINLINVVNDSSKDFLENLFLINHQSGNPTFSSHLKLTSPEVKNDVFDHDQVIKPLFPSPILDKDSDSFLEKSDTSLSLLEYKTFIDHTKEMNSGSTTTHAD